MKLEAIAVKEDGKAFRIINRELLYKELTELPKGRYPLSLRNTERRSLTRNLVICSPVFILTCYED